MNHFACHVSPWLPGCVPPKPSWFMDGISVAWIGSGRFARLLRFQADCVDTRKPKVLVVPPLSGQHPSLLRDVVRVLAASGRDVHVADWISADLVPVELGEFGLQDNIRCIAHMFEMLPDSHVVAVSQSCVAAFAAACMLCESGKASPRSLTLIGGPMDVARRPTEVVRRIESLGLGWFEQRMQRVPHGLPGAGRLVFPAYERHLALLPQMPVDRADVESSEDLDEFYREYYATMDLDGKYFIEVIDAVFLRRSLACGTLVVDESFVKASALRDVALMTVAGTLDITVAPQQVYAVHEWTPQVARSSSLTVEANHFELVYGRRWRERIAPAVLAFMGNNE